MNEIKIVIEGLNELTQALRALAGCQPAQGPGMGQTVPVQGQAPNAPAGCGVPVHMPQTGQMPMQQMVPAGNMPMQQGNLPQTGLPVQQAVPGGGVPTTAAAREYTIEQLQVAAAGLTSSGKMPQVMGILQSFGIQAMTELRKDQYGAFATALREAGAQI